ncbi:MAG: hypothetical protein QG670_764 [Thermoproteota archaeon]|nr:hypothetical protein [Thermoproteota archaeon]
MFSALTQKKPLWICPKCGAKFVTKNMWHSCGSWSLESFFEGKGLKAREFFETLVSLTRRCGSFEFAPTKTAVYFMVRVRFAQVYRVSEKGMTFGFWLKRKIDNTRFSRVDYIPKNNWVYTVRITRREELDEEVLSWLCEAYKVGKGLKD